MKANYIDVCGEVARDVSPTTREIVQFMGGITAQALSAPSLRVNPDSRVVEAPSTLALSTTRENGTLRDLDILALTTDAGIVDNIQDEVSGIVDGRLDVSVFGIRPAEILGRQARHPMGFSALKTFLSDRYRANDGQLYRALFPFSVPISDKTIESWTLAIGDNEIPMPAPSATVLNYTQRSISGLRYKDTPKWLAMVSNLKNVYPDFQCEILDGDFSDQAQLTRLIESLRDNRGIVSETLALPRISPEELVYGPFMMLKQPDRVALTAVNLARFKAKSLAFFESNEEIVGFWQQHVERRADAIVKNQ
jgi:hypothetical protein